MNQVSTTIYKRRFWRRWLKTAMALSLIASIAGAPYAQAATEAPEESESTTQAGQLTSLTISIYEIVMYDDPTFDDPSGLRLLETQVIDGLEVGQEIDLWDYVEQRDDFLFFDGWPRYLTLSENPEENQVQLHYMRTKSPSTVHYYLVGEAAAQAKSAPIIENVDGVPVSFWKMGTYQVDSLPLGAQIESERCAVELDGLVYLAADKASIAVDPVADANEINLFYTVDTATTLPDDAPVESTTGGQPDDTEDGDQGASGGSTDDGNSSGSTDAGAGSAPAGDDAPAGSLSTDEEGSADAENDPLGMEDEEDSTVVIEEEESPLAAAHDGVLELPQTGDGLWPWALALSGLAAAALAAMAFGRRAIQRF